LLINIIKIIATESNLPAQKLKQQEFPHIL